MESTNINQVVVQFVINNNSKATGFWFDINESQVQTLEKFKEKILAEGLLTDLGRFDDLYLLRFLRARKFDLTKTYDMFATFIKWRKDNQVDEIESFDFKELLPLKSLYPHGYHKTDKYGRPIYIELLSKVDLKEVFKVTSEDRMVKYYIKEYERLMKYRFPSCTQAAGKIIEQSLTILDMDGIGLSMLGGKTKEFVKLASDIGQNYYPEMLGTMFLINTSFFFSAVWAIVSMFIDEKTKKKINIERSGYAKKLLELVDADNLPKFLGGNCTCSQFEGGCLFSDIGPWNPSGGIGNGYTTSG